jgi:hypothetical protein
MWLRKRGRPGISPIANNSRNIFDLSCFCAINLGFFRWERMRIFRRLGSAPVAGMSLRIKLDLLLLQPAGRY